MSLHPSRCNGYVAAQDNKAARQSGVRRLAVFLALLLLAPASAAAAPKPNLLVIMTDDQRADGTLEVMPETRRRIGRQGTTFLEAHAATPKCCPSRASFFTGLYPHNHGVITNVTTGLLDHTTTVQRLVRRRGYSTGIFGKFLNGWPVEVNPPFFDDWAITNGTYERGYWNVDGRVGTRSTYSTELIANRATRFIRRAERRDDRPWLAWVTPYAPHLPSTPPPRYEDAPLPPFPFTPAMAEADWSDKPSVLDRARGFPRMIETMRDDGRRALMAVDDMVGELLDELRLRREHRDTLVVFTSDNGFMLGEHGGLAAKDLPYPASTRIPLLARWPGHFRAGGSNTKLVSNIDVATTLFEAAGVRRRTDGRSLLSPGRRRVLFMEHHGGSNGEPDALPLPPWRAMLTRTFRYTEYFEEGRVIGREYYDHGVDPWELENRADLLPPERVAERSESLRTWGTCRGRTCP